MLILICSDVNWPGIENLVFTGICKSLITERQSTHYHQQNCDPCDWFHNISRLRLRRASPALQQIDDKDCRSHQQQKMDCAAHCVRRDHSKQPQNA